MQLGELVDLSVLVPHLGRPFFSSMQSGKSGNPAQWLFLDFIWPMLPQHLAEHYRHSSGKHNAGFYFNYRHTPSMWIGFLAPVAFRHKDGTQLPAQPGSIFAIGVLDESGHVKDRHQNLQIFSDEWRDWTFWQVPFQSDWTRRVDWEEGLKPIREVLSAASPSA
jgi:hypothetical protein